MIVQPIIPIWIMAIICIGLIALKRKRIAAFVRQIIIVILIFMINLNLCFVDGKSNVKTEKTNAYIMFVIDTTISMKARDYKGNQERIAGVKADCQHIMEMIPGARYSVITYNNMAQLAAPFSDNSMHIMNTINNVSFPYKYYAKGTAMDDCVKLVEDRLAKMTEKDQGKKDIYVFYISDGEITSENAKLPSFKGIQQYINGGAVLGYGTEKGGKMYVEDLAGKEEVLTYRNENFEEVEAISKFDEGNLKSIADDMGLSYVHMENGNEADSELKNIQDNLQKEKVVDEAANTKSTGAYFAIPLALLLLYEFFSIHVRHKEKI